MVVKLQEFKNGRSDLDRIGLFSETSYISTGEPFQKTSSNFERINNIDGFLDYRVKGKQFQVLPSKIGKHDPNYNRIFENEAHSDLVVLRRRNRILEGKKNISSTPFKPSSVPPKPSGKGSHWGTIEQQWPTIKKKAVSLKQVNTEVFKKETTPNPKNVVTRPPKKGSGYGYPDVTIGKPYEYLSDPYDRAESLLRKEREENKKKVSGMPFITSSGNPEFFNKFICLSVDDQGSKKPGSAPAGSHSDKLPSIVPFKPTSKCGYTINPYPSYEAPKFHPKEEKSLIKSQAIFKPPGKPGSYPIMSITQANCPLGPPSWLKENLRTVIAECAKKAI